MFLLLLIAADIASTVSDDLKEALQDDTKLGRYVLICYHLVVEREEGGMERGGREQGDVVWLLSRFND